MGDRSAVNRIGDILVAQIIPSTIAPGTLQTVFDRNMYVRSSLPRTGHIAQCSRGGPSGLN